MRIRRRGEAARPSSTSGKRVVAVTGAAGRVGRAVLAILADAGTDVIAIDRRGGDGPGEWRRADLTSERQTRSAMRGATDVIHLAAWTAPDPSDPTKVVIDNITMAANVLNAFAAGTPRTAAVASSVSAYGMAWGESVLSPLYLPIDEDHPCWASDTYSVSKLMTEQLCAMWSLREGITTIALRFPWVGDDDADRVRPHVAALREDAGGEIGRRQLWSYIHVDDVAQALVLALDVADGGHHVLNVAAPDLLVDESLTDLMARFHPATELRPGLEESGPWSTRRAADLLGWHAQNRMPD